MRRPPSLLCALLAVAACDECDPIAGPDAGPAGAPALAFIALPVDVGCADDDDGTVAGFQLAVGIELRDDDGSGFDAVTVTNSRNLAEATVPLAGGAAVATLELVGAEAPGAENTITATSVNDDLLPLSASAVVRVTCAPPAPAARCEISAPTSGTAVLGSSVVVAVTCSGEELSDAQRALVDSGQVRVDLADATGATQSAAADLESGNASVSLPLSTGGAHTITATLVDGAAPLLFDPPLSASVAITH